MHFISRRIYADKNKFPHYGYYTKRISRRLLARLSFDAAFQVTHQSHFRKIFFCWLDYYAIISDIFDAGAAI